jgi:hypothetical protein
VEVREGTEEKKQARAGVVYLAFAALAVLAGPVNGYVSGAMLVATNLQVFAGMAMASLLAGIALSVYALARKGAMLGRREWGTLLLLLIPQWGSVLIASSANFVPWLHSIGEGTALLLSLAAPLWIALVVAFDLISFEIPMVSVAAAIVGIGAACLIIPANTYGVGWSQLPMLLLQVLLGLVTVITWAITRSPIYGGSIEAAVGGYLLLSALGDGFFALVYERTKWQPLDWHGLLAPLLCEAAMLAVSWWLWFFLLQRVTLAAFGMRALAAWVASVIAGIGLAGFVQWRVDAALMLAVGAVVVALRARVADEQPTALGLGEA